MNCKQCDLSLKETQIIERDPSDRSSIEPGLYAHLLVKDNGTGMKDEVLERIFDPYFTTKSIGKGTGMGLSIVHGIVKSHNGHITVNSTPGQGTEFNVYFPIIEAKPVVDNEPIALQSARGSESILLVDDEEDFLSMAQEMMEMLGYSVTAEQSSTDALELFKQDISKFDLVVTDHVMPGLSGTRLAKKLLNLRPDIPIVLCTGYSPNLTRNTVTDIGIKGMLFKPLVIEDLSKTLRQSLES